MVDPFSPPHASGEPVPGPHAVAKPKVDKPPRVKSARSVISEVAAEGAKGRVGKEMAKRILEALEANGLEVTSKPYVKPVEAKRKEEAKTA